MDYIDANFLSLCKAIEMLSGRCVTISIPIKKTPHYDLIADTNGNILRIKIIRTEHESSKGNFVINLRTGSQKKDFIPSTCEFLFIDTPEGQYLIPSFEIQQKRCVRIGKFKKYIIHDK